MSTKFLPLIIFITFTNLTNSQISQGYERMVSDNDPNFKDYELLMYEASEYLLTNPINPKSNDFQKSIKIIDFWKNKDTGVNIPILGKFYTALPEEGPHRYFYMIAMINHVLSEKLNNSRILKCVKIDGKKYSEQKDVKEVQIEGAKIFLNYAKDKKNGIILDSEAKKYLKAYKNGKLDKIFF